MNDFHPIVRQWFETTHGKPSPPQELGWPSIASGKHTLILAPTGSGKTLAAFLWAINHLFEQRLDEAPQKGVHILYISPLKALNNDVERNLRGPLAGIKELANTSGLRMPTLRAMVRTGDTPQSQRASMLTKPPDILITTPESLYLMLTSRRARTMFSTVQYLIVDEIHALCGNKRGVHLSISLERLAEVAQQDFLRIGLSATQRPLEKIADFLGGYELRGKELRPRPVNIVDAGYRKHMDLAVQCVVPDLSLLPQESVWPEVFEELLRQIRSHSTTLIFVNNRRLAERVAAKLNEMFSGMQDTFNLRAVPTKTTGVNSSDSSLPFQVKAYHGSMSKHAREQMESELKAGKLRALIATSSLELGIDIGSVDLVIQLESPKGVARGLQRVGRSGHVITATSKGRMFPVHREDLVESAVVARAMVHHDVERTAIPANCLDVLAQQITAMVSIDDWDVDDLYNALRRSSCYNSLPRGLYINVLSMLAGRYTDDAFRGLRARISWDKVHNNLKALPGTSRLAIMSGGTIPDRGYYGVYLEDGKTRVGEVDEEFILESRVGDTFILGTSVWRMESIDANRVVVTPAPGQPARMPFWRGEGIGRTRELGLAVSEFRREMSERLNTVDCLGWLQQEFHIDNDAAWNIREYFQKQQEVARCIPHDRLLLVEYFRDDIGDPRIIVHSSYGRRINGLLGLVCVERLRQRISVEPQMLYNDNGVLLRYSDVDELPDGLLDGLTVQEAADIVLREILASPLFGGQFRQNASRALLLPGIGPGRRTPLWLQRLRSADLLQVARSHDDFPIVIETVREVLNDILDFEHFKEIISGVEQGAITLHTIHTETPSPFAAGLLFDFIGVYMYEWDQPKMERQSQFLSVNRELLSEVVDVTTMTSLLRPDAIATVESQLQRIAEGYKARSAEELLEFLVHLGDLSDAEVIARTENGSTSMIEVLAADGRALRVRVGTEDRWIAGEDAPFYRGLERDENASVVLRRYLRNHGPIPASQISRKFAFTPDRSVGLLKSMATEGAVVSGRFQQLDNAEIQWCYRPSLEQIHRATIHILRREIKPCSIEAFTDFLCRWQGLASRTHFSGTQGVIDCLEQFQGLTLPVELWEREIMSRRVPGYDPSMLGQVTASGGIVWMGSGMGKIRPIVSGCGNIFVEEDNQPQKSTPEKILSYLDKNGASFFGDIRNGTGLSLEAINNGLADLMWSGFISNDVWEEILNIRSVSGKSDDEYGTPVTIVNPWHNPGRSRMVQRARRSIKQIPGWRGRWYLVRTPAIMGEPMTPEERHSHLARILLERYGILAREFCKRENIASWPLLARELQTMEMRGEIRRGYFVEGLSGMQFALPEAVEQLRASSQLSREEIVLINACDPANPYGSGMELREPLPSLSRLPKNYLLLSGGIPVMTIENNGLRVWTKSDAPESTLEEGLRRFVSMLHLPDRLRPFKSITIQQWNGVPVGTSPHATLLKRLGFTRHANQTMRLDDYR